MSTANKTVAAKRAAGHRAVDENIKPEFKFIGIGSGSTVVFCVERIAQLRNEGVLPIGNMYFVPTGFQSKQLLVEAKLHIMEIDQFSTGELDVVFDGADEIDAELNCIKGGGACLFQEKLVGMCSKRFVAVVDHSKVSDKLGTKWLQGIPIEVVPLAHTKVALDLTKLGAKSVTLRQGGKAKAGPVVTDNGNFILDAYFGEIDPKEVQLLHKKIKLLVGVLETGLFSNCEAVYIGDADGGVSLKARPEKSEQTKRDSGETA